MIPQHPARQQQGLGAPTAQSSTNPYYQPNEALSQATGRFTGANDLALAQAQEAGARAGKAKAEADIMAGLGALGQQVQAGPEVTPQQIQAEQLADGLISGKIDQNYLQQLLQAGEVDPQVAEAAMGMAQGEMQRRAQEGALMDQQQGLGPI